MCNAKKQKLNKQKNYLNRNIKYQKFGKERSRADK